MVEGSTQKLYRNPKKNRKKRERSCRVSWTDMIRTRATHKALRRKKLQPPAATAICLYVCLLLVCDRSLKKRTLMPEAPAINNTHVLLPVLVVLKLSHLH
jgi:hypothetical protein